LVPAICRTPHPVEGLTRLALSGWDGSNSCLSPPIEAFSSFINAGEQAIQVPSPFSGLIRVSSEVTQIFTTGKSKNQSGNTRRSRDATVQQPGNSRRRLRRCEYRSPAGNLRPARFVLVEK